MLPAYNSVDIHEWAHKLHTFKPQPSFRSPSGQPCLATINTTTSPSKHQAIEIQLWKKMSFSSLFEHGVKNPISCPWPSCRHPRTDSFRGNENIDEVIFVHFDAVHTSDSCFTDSSESLESVIRGAVQSDRFFFEPGDKLILEEVKNDDEMSPLEKGVALTVQSDDPYIDFRASMEEMVEVHGLKDLEWLLELLQWCLMMNRKRNHGFIIRAFLDLMEGIASSFHCDEGHSNYFAESIET